MRPEIFREVADTMRPPADGLSAEVDLVHARRVHQTCEANEFCGCGLLKAAGAFYTTVAGCAVARRMDDVRELLLTNWVDVAVAYDAGYDISDPVFRMYSTAVTFRLLTS